MREYRVIEQQPRILKEEGHMSVLRLGEGQAREVCHDQSAYPAEFRLVCN